MSDTSTDTTQAPETTPETPAEKRERRSFPIRIFVRGEGGWSLVADVPGFDEQREAERWVKAQGVDSATYMLARVIGAREVSPRTVREVTL